MNRQRASLFVHYAVLILWVTELVLFPMLAVLELGYSISVGSNFLLRFPYIILLLLATLFHALGNAIVLPKISIFMMIIALIASIKGIIEGNLNAGFASHVFYLVMPIIMISYGVYFFKEYQQNRYLRTVFNWVMIISLIAGAIAVAFFIWGQAQSRSSYNAVGLWNMMFSGPYLVNNKYGMFYLLIATLCILLAAKRGLILAFACYAVTGFLIKNKRLLWITALPIALLIVEHDKVFDEFNIETTIPSIGVSSSERLAVTVEAASSGNVDGAVSGRMSEALSAINHLNTRWDHWVVGAGFGATFVPWEASPDYTSKYTHFSPLSYVWVGGVFLSLAIYGFLFSLGISMLRKARSREIERQHFFLVYWLGGIIALSMFGAVLMNNSWLWFLIGGCLAVNGSQGVLLGASTTFVDTFLRTVFKNPKLQKSQPDWKQYNNDHN